MTRWYHLEPTDADVFEQAPHVFTYQKRFAADGVSRISIRSGGQRVARRSTNT